MRLPFSAMRSSPVIPATAIPFPPKSTPFLLHSNVDGRLESICLHCFRTVLVSHDRANLNTAEASHRCDQFDLRLAHGLLEELPARG